MATEEKKNQERPAVYILTQEQINQIAAVGAKEGVKAFRRKKSVSVRKKIAR